VRGAQRTLAAVVLTAALVVGLVTTDRAVRAQHAANATVAGAQRVNGRLALLGRREAFIDFVSGIVPPHAAIRIVQPPAKHPVATSAGSGPGAAGVCGHSVDSAVYWLVVYELSPRPSVCDLAGAWTVYFGVQVPDQAGAHRYSTTLGVLAP
jgi:hypothetical protein